MYVCYSPPPSLFCISYPTLEHALQLTYISPLAASRNPHFSQPSLRTSTVHVCHDNVRTPCMLPMPIDPRASTHQEQRPRPTGAWHLQSSGSAAHPPLAALRPLALPAAAPSWPAPESIDHLPYNNQTRLTGPTGLETANIAITRPINRQAEQRAPPLLARQAV